MNVTHSTSKSLASIILVANKLLRSTRVSARVLSFNLRDFNGLTEPAYWSPYAKPC